MYADIYVTVLMMAPIHRMTPPSRSLMSPITRTVALCAAGWLAFAAPAPAQENAPTPRFAIYYDKTAPASAFEPYSLIVLDSDHHPDLRPLAERGKMLLGYLSLGEVEMQRIYFKRLKDKGLVMEDNKNWPGSHFIDIRNPLWQKLVLEDLIPHILSQGFQGVFLDTLDSPIELERSQPQKFKGMRQAAVQLVKAMRAQYPEMKIMINRAYPLLAELAPSVDYVLGESVYADYNFDTKKYGRVEPALYGEQVAWLKSAKAANPAIGIYTLDYAQKDDNGAIREIYAAQRKNGFIPYVATVDLNELVPEPGQ